MNKHLAAVILLFLLCSTSSCNLYRRISKSPKAVPGADSALVIEKRSTPVLFPDTMIVMEVDTALHARADTAMEALVRQWEPLWNVRAAYTTFSGKAKAQYDGAGESHELTVTFRLEKDKRLWVSVTALGGYIEVARALLTPDSAIIIDRFHKEVRYMALSGAGAALGLASVDFGSLQDILIGEPLRAGISLGHVELQSDTLSLAGTNGNISQQLRFLKGDSLLHWQWLMTNAGTLEQLYDDYKQAGTRPFAYSRLLLLSKDNVRENARISLEFSKAAFDEPVEMSFQIPEKYERK